MTKIVCISDNHSNYDFEVPEADILIHSGDFSYKGHPDEMWKCINWLDRQPHKHKLWIPGNHELIEDSLSWWKDTFLEHSNAICLHNLREPIEIERLKFWGTSITPTFGKWAFMMDDNQRERLWKYAPEDVDVLVSHGPSYKLLDRVDGREDNLGCKFQREYVDRVKPKLTVNGHIHSAHGIIKHNNTTVVNASLLDERYEMVNKPITIEI